MRSLLQGGVTIRKGSGPFWLFFVFAVWILPTGIAWFFAPSLELNFLLLLWQHSWFVFGGLYGSRRETLVLPQAKAIFTGILSGVGLFVLNGTAGWYSQKLLSFFFGSQLVEKLILQERAGVDVFLRSNNTLLVTGVMFLLVFGAPLGEELFFRGFILAGLGEKMGKTHAILLSSLLFAVLHFYFIQFIPVLLSGIYLGILFVRTKKIAVPIIAHSTSNLLVLLIYLQSL